MTYKQNNPAARLFKVLTALHSQSPKTSLLDAWRSALNLFESDNTSLKFLRRYGLVLALPVLVRDELLRVPELNSTPFLKWRPKLQVALTRISLTQPLEAFLMIFNEQGFDSLEAATEILSRQRPENTVDDTEALMKVLRDAEQLRCDTEAAPLETGLKEYILEILDEVSSAIEEYDLRGIAGLERSVDHAFGSLLRKRDRIVPQIGNDLVSRTLHLVYAAYLIVNTANGVFQLPHNMQQFLISCGVEKQSQPINQNGGAPTDSSGPETNNI